ncbi:hypothetical protein RN001_015968 [Aquatica leii]|uniref:CUB domain-containing protein n=1 Tax=Aquatica leii TaxID=1421715 RepID=A0AAN7SB51_9COLE|nr:hypothetical protein RN001_015968 [Aquatica leii]
MPSLHLFIWIWLAWLSRGYFSNAQLAWTPIYVDGNSQIDLWTQESKGCPCPWNVNNHQCACCVQDGGCHCGKESPNRCTQCGLEKHCSFMCNMSITSTELQKHSGKSFGQIKSPSLEGPDHCWFTFVPSPTERVEIQIYRLLNVGRFNGSSCVGGFLQLMSGVEPIFSSTDNNICGVNERFSPPVVLFSDDGVASLLFQIFDKTRRSQFLAYFSFTSINNTEGLGFQPRGGMKLQNTDCDWLYQDFACVKLGICTISSPNYPGIYPPNRQCKYHITTSNDRMRVRITFNTLLLPQNYCSTDYVAIYHGSTRSSPHLITLCANQKKSVDYPGPKLLLEFSSGPQVPPYNYNGFVANLEFYEKTTTTEPSLLLFSHTMEQLSNAVQHPKEISTAASYKFKCEITISGNNTRSGHFDTREYEWFPTCRLIFKGRVTDVIHISLFNYRLRAPQCRSVIEIFDGFMEDTKGPIDKLCSPLIKQTYDIEAQNTHVKKYLSTKNIMVILLRRPTAPSSTNEAEFLSGSFFFHDEQISGTMQPNGLCDVKYNGVNSPLAGLLDNPGLQQLYWNIDGPLICTQQFVPAVNQSVIIKILGLEHMAQNPSCITQCGDNGCRCVSKSNLQRVDHFVIVNEEGWTIACLCGAFQPEWFPVSVRSWSSLTVIYSVAHYIWSNKGFSFSASYTFNTDTICSDQIYTLHSGEIVLKNISTPDNLNHFYHQTCTWTLHSNVERQLELDITSKQNRPCTAWNISVHEYSASAKDRHLGELLHSFCSRDSHKQYLLPWKLNTVIIRLKTLSRTLPQFRIKWKSQVIRANTRFGTPTAAPNAVSSVTCLQPSVSIFLILLILTGLHCENGTNTYR